MPNAAVSRTASPSSEWRRFPPTTNTDPPRPGGPPEHFDPVFIDVARDLKNRGALAALRSRRSGLNHKTLIALDGTEYFNFYKISCPNCLSRTHNKGTDNEMVENYHKVLGAAIVDPGQVAAVPLPVEIIRPRDGSKKQVCKRNAAKLWLRRIGPRLKEPEPVYLGDDLYACQPVCEVIRATGGNFILTTKRSSHKTLYEELDRCHPQTLFTRVTRDIKKPKKYSYIWQPDLRIRGGAAAMPMTWVCLEIHDMAAKKVTYRTAFVTDLPVSRTNVADIVTCGRSRWRVENAEFNVLKILDFNHDRNFGQGKKNLASVLLDLNLLAFALHTACDLAEKHWQKARTVCGTRDWMFRYPQVLTARLVFDDWKRLMQVLAGEVDIPP